MRRLTTASRRKRPEQALHQQVAKFLAVALRFPTFWTTFPAGGGGRIRGAILKSMGLKDGVPDILIFCAGYPDGMTRVIGLELKAEKGKLTPAQKDMGKTFEAFGGLYLVARSVNEVEVLLFTAGVPLVATTGTARFSKGAKNVLE